MPEERICDLVCMPAVSPAGLQRRLLACNDVIDLRCFEYLQNPLQLDYSSRFLEVFSYPFQRAICRPKPNFT